MVAAGTIGSIGPSRTKNTGTGKRCQGDWISSAPLSLAQMSSTMPFAKTGNVCAAKMDTQEPLQEPSFPKRSDGLPNLSPSFLQPSTAFSKMPSTHPHLAPAIKTVQKSFGSRNKVPTNHCSPIQSVAFRIAAWQCRGCARCTLPELRALVSVQDTSGKPWTCFYFTLDLGQVVA